VAGTYCQGFLSYPDYNSPGVVPVILAQPARDFSKHQGFQAYACSDDVVVIYYRVSKIVPSTFGVVRFAGTPELTKFLRQVQ
jgi:hypothetical protein